MQRSLKWLSGFKSQNQAQLIILQKKKKLDFLEFHIQVQTELHRLSHSSSNYHDSKKLDFLDFHFTKNIITGWSPNPWS